MKIIAKLGKMRKAVEWIVYPPRSDGMILIQSDRRICAFDPTTGKGRLSGSHNYPVALTLQMPDAEDIDVPADVIAAVMNAQPQKGDKIGAVGRIA